MSELKNPNIRNFVIISHIDHGKSTLADRFLELTGAVDKRKMREQYLDQMELERERGITIKMAPVRMLYHSDRGITLTDTRTNAENHLLYEDITYKIRSAIFAVKKNISLGHKELIYQKALEEEFKKIGLYFEKQKIIDVFYNNKKVGVYQPDFVIEDKIIVEIKALPFLGQTEEKQLWSYLKGSHYKLALLVNFGGKDIEIKRIVYDLARFPRESASGPRGSAQVEYILNLIDTPGHADFSYEVSRALAAVEGAVLLVDGTKGIQAQTVAHLNIAKSLNLKIIAVINKIDLNPPAIEELAYKVAKLVGIKPEEILKISAKTGYNVDRLLELIVKNIPPPEIKYRLPSRALIFDSFYDNHRGVVAYVRVVDGVLSKDEKLWLAAKKNKFDCQEIGFFTPELKAERELKSGEIGYVATGIKDVGMVQTGDTICSFKEWEQIKAFIGYQEPQRVIFASIWPEDPDNFENLHSALAKLRLNDTAFIFEIEKNEILGRGFKVGFLGLLHLDITIERLKKEYKLEVLTTAPSVVYKVRLRNNQIIEVCSANDLPAESDIKEIEEPLVHLTITLPEIYFNQLFQLQEKFRMRLLQVDSSVSLTVNPEGARRIENLGQNVVAHFEIPLQELILDFNDELKTVSQGYASMNYEISGYQKTEVTKLEVLVVGEVVPVLARILPKEKVNYIGRALVKNLKETLPRQLFSVAIQARANGRIIARETLSALKKDVTGYLYGGDRSRKMKLWAKQKKGKKRLKSIGRISIPPDVYKKILSK